MRRTIRLCVAGALTASLAVALPAGADGHLETVMTGIDNPRGLTFDAAGNLYVASAGTGGAAPCIPAPEGEGETCYGNSGAIYRLPNAQLDVPDNDAADHDLVTGLPSLAPQEGEFAQGDASGPADVSISGANLYFTIGLGADPAVRDGVLEPAANEDDMASLHSVVAADGSMPTKIADLGDHEATPTDPDGAGPDTNPFGVVADAAGGTATVLDSGGNTVLEVDLGDGTVTTGAVLPPTFVPAPPFLGAPSGTEVPAQAVPTGIAALDGGGFVVGQLTGFPFAVGSAGVWNYETGTATPWYLGFTNIMDVAQGDDGAIYVLELASDGLLTASADNPPMGSLIRVTEESGTVTRELLLDDVFMPGGLAIHDGWAYMTTGSAFPAGAVPPAGQVVRFDLDADPLLTIRDDAATTDEDERLVAGDAEDDQFTTVTADVTANDDGVVEVTPLDVAKGAVTGSIVYQPRKMFNSEDQGVDVVPYRGCDDDGNCANGVLEVTVRKQPIDRIAGIGRMETAVEASMGHYPNGAHTVVVARADLYPDALTGGPLAHLAGGPILLTQGDVLTPVVEAEIQRLAPSTIYVLGGTAAINEDVEETLGGMAETVTRLGGIDRFETAVKVMEELDVLRESPAMMAYVVEGVDPDPNRGWPDAVSVSGLASWNGSPILLVATEVVPDSTAAALDGVDATIIGGEVAINAATRARIAELADDVTEIAGENRYETSYLVAEQGVQDRLFGSRLILVSGGNWPDALVAGPLAAQNMQSAMMLVHPTDIAGSPETVEFIDDHGPFPDVDLFGGPAAISDAVAGAIAQANQ